MRPCLSRFLPLVMLFVPVIAAAQLPVPIAIEGRIGWAVPQGEFADGADGFSAGGGPSVAIGARVDPIPLLGIVAGYQQTWFDCGTCAAVALDDAVVLKAYEAGLNLSIPIPGSDLSPWLRGAVTQQTLGFTGSGQTFTSEVALGFAASGGVVIPLAGRLQISPGIRYQSGPAEFEFSTLPDREIDVSAFAADITLAFRL